ncbi:MAG: hypothetical protein M0R20_04010 [Candidatus Omnitrophica bacterium]|jgi:hypothetical protein|nr:hypothetical protein [Candidatus Omnitrophota bacterium]
MRKTAVLLIIVTLFTIGLVYAHPPSDIKITFSPDTKMLNAAIYHNTSNPVSHHIKKVDIGLNGKEIIEHHISRQDNNEIQSVAYLVPDAKDGDVLSVEGYCSISGKLKKEVTVKSGK